MTAPRVGIGDQTARGKRALVQQAQRLATQGEWDEAIELNNQILAASPNDVQALNRLGKAYSELHRYEESYETYSRALEIDPANQIARHNVERLELLKGLGGQGGQGANGQVVEHRHTQVRQAMFIEEIGKTRVVDLEDVAPDKDVVQMSPGDRVDIRVEHGQLVAYCEDGLRLGRLPARLAVRLIELIEGGNRYGGAITAVAPGMLRVIVRELYQHPSQQGRLSFPVETRPTLPRPYLRDSQRTRFLGDDQDFLATDEDEDEIDEETEVEEEEDEFTEETSADDTEEDEEQTV
jgi:tetratricopeptide (TPR) repeat protein